MQEWLQRVVDEQQQLDEKLTKLNAYIMSDAFDSLDKQNRVLLIQQQAFMSAYLEVLIERININ